MPGKRRSMADLMAGQGAIENPLGGDPRPGKDAPEPPPATAMPVPAAAGVPEPRTEAGDGPLSAVEQSDLSTCEAALDNLRMAFWAAGKALQTVRDGRLYRDSYATFEDYCADRWDMTRAQAYRLIDAWPLAERLSPMGDKINERQVRELLPVVQDHGQDAAVLVYETVAGTDGITVTAAVLHKVVGILPADDFDRDKAVAQIRAYLAGGLVVRALPAADPVQVFTSASVRLRSVLRDIASPDIVRAVRDLNPELASQTAANLRAMADVLDPEITA